MATLANINSEVAIEIDLNHPKMVDLCMIAKFWVLIGQAAPVLVLGNL